MKKELALALGLFCISTRAQNFAPVGTAGGYNRDAIAEATTALANTSGAIDGSDYVMYSVAYGTVYSSGTGLPNNGLIAGGTGTYQLQSYTANNVLYLTASQIDTLVLTTPASFGALSLLAFSTEGSATMSVTVRFTDNSAQAFTNLQVPDWFNTGNTVISGFDRCGRNSGTPNFQTSQPKMFNTDMVINCTNRSKQVARIIVQHTGTSARLVVMAVSGVPMPVYSVSVTPVSCAGGTNGSATITASGGIGPFTYTVNSTPTQFNPTPSGLSTGVYSYTSQDAALCPVTSTFAITQSLVPQPALNISASGTAICAGKSVTLSASGASTYTWNAGASGPFTVVVPGSTTTYTVDGHTSANCFRTGTVEIVVNALPVVTLAGPLSSVCTNGGTHTLTGNPPGGNFSGPGTAGNLFNPVSSGTGNFVLTYSFTDVNGCSGSSTVAVSVQSLALPQLTSPGRLCLNAATSAFTANPGGGQFAGVGVNASGVISPSLAGAGSHTVSYSLSAGVCSVVTSGNFTVVPLPTVTFSLSKSFFCTKANAIPLNANPSTGTYSGTGVSGSFFSPTTAGIGTHTITYTYTDLNGCTVKTAATATVSECLAFEERLNNGVTVFPNPANDQIYIVSSDKIEITLISSSGKIVFLYNAGMGETITVPTSALAEGIYLVHARSVSGSTQSKVIVAH
jgi:hypothetical protein